METSQDGFQKIESSDCEPVSADTTATLATETAVTDPKAAAPKVDPLAKIIPSPVVQVVSDEVFQGAMAKHRLWLESVLDPRKEALWGQRANFSGQDFSGMDLEAIDLRGADLSGAKLDGAYLRGANLSGAKMVGTSLVGTDLCEANLSRCNLTNANLQRANMKSATLRDATIDQADFNGADLLDARVNQPRLQRMTAATEATTASPVAPTPDLSQP